MIFASDNWAGASPRVMAALTKAAEGTAPAYGNDSETAAVSRAMSDLFERDVVVRLVPSGTAANMLALAALTPAHGVIFAHDDAHVLLDECGAVELATDGALVQGVPGVGGQISVEGIERALERFPPHIRFRRPATVSLTQATECGTVYSLADIRRLTDFAQEKGLKVHMDGARFANAVAALGCSPADVTWRAGIDALSFGGTKNGALMAEAVVFFSDVNLEEFDRNRQRLGHGLSKMRPIALQFLALLENGHWLDLARHANAMAARLGDRLMSVGHRLAWPVEANEVFVILREAEITALRAAGARVSDWPSRNLATNTVLAADERVIRLVCSFATGEVEVERFVTLAAR